VPQAAVISQILTNAKAWLVHSHINILSLPPILFCVSLFVIATMLYVCDQVEGEQGDQDEQVHSQPMLGVVR